MFSLRDIARFSVGSRAVWCSARVLFPSLISLGRTDDVMTMFPTPSYGFSARGACPVWCRGLMCGDTDEMGAHIHPDDQRHESQTFLVPALTRHVRRSSLGAPLEVRVTTEEFSVLLHHRDDAPEVWVAIAGDSSNVVEITLESATRLHAALGALLTEATSGSTR